MTTITITNKIVILSCAAKRTSQAQVFYRSAVATLLSRLRRCPFPQSHITHRTSTVSSTTFTQHSGSYIYPRHPQFQSPNQSTVCKKQQQTRTTMATCSKALLLAILSCAFVCSAVHAARDLTDDSAMAARHELWMSQYGRVYKDDAEKAQRFEVFKANVKFIESFNATGNRKFWLGINQFADLTNAEFRATKTNKGFKPSPVKVPTGFRYENVSIDALPASIDWRTKGAVTPIKDQGQCGMKNNFI